MNKSILFLGALLVLGVMIVFVLFALSEDKESRRYDFERKIVSDIIEEEAVADFGYDGYYLAGATHNRLYFGYTWSPLHMIESGVLLNDTMHVKLKIAEPDKLKFRSIQLKVDSPYFFLVDGTQPCLLRGTLREKRARRFMYDSAWFSISLPVSPSSFIVRSQNALTKEDMLGKEASGTVVFFPKLLQKQFDGLFCVDGALHYSKTLSKVVYLYYYRNQYIVMDTSLNLAYRANTIDPIAVAQIKADSFKTGGVQTLIMSSPPLLVNKKSCVYENWLLVNSAIRSNKEDEETIGNTSVIDVYDLTKGAYLFSFYVPMRNGSSLEGMWACNGRLYAKFDKYMVCYKLMRKDMDVT